jgi:hypothetical protein
LESAPEDSRPGPGPIPLAVTRWKCPHCSRSRAAKKATAEHIGRCWYNPAVRGCKTCKYFEPYIPYGDEPEGCGAGIDLNATSCKVCGFDVRLDDERTCPEHPDAETIVAGPIIHCELWEDDDD